MRVGARFFLVFVLVLVVVLVLKLGSKFLAPARTGREEETQEKQRISTNGLATSHQPIHTNQAAEPQDGFYLGKGDQRVFVKYATPDPVLRSFMQSVMNDSSDPNAKGREIFLKLCAICHQPDGAGKDGVAPPLVGSEWALTPGGGRMVRIVLNGMTGPVRVRGRDWNLTMPPWRENLTDDQIAVVLTYVRSQLGSNHAGPVTSEFVAAVRKEAHAKTQTSDELLRIADP
jgi:mono/diheme cytochrome c family protein